VISQGVALAKNSHRAIMSITQAYLHFTTTSHKVNQGIAYLSHDFECAMCLGWVPRAMVVNEADCYVAA